MKILTQGVVGAAELWYLKSLQVATTAPSPHFHRLEGCNLIAAFMGKSKSFPQIISKTLDGDHSLKIISTVFHEDPSPKIIFKALHGDPSPVISKALHGNHSPKIFPRELHGDRFSKIISRAFFHGDPSPRLQGIPWRTFTKDYLQGTSWKPRKVISRAFH